MSRIRLDATQETVLAVCTCGWRQLTLSRSGAMAEAVAHEVRAHPGNKQAVNLASKARTRGHR